MAKKAMSKKDLVMQVAEAAGTDRKVVAAVLDGIAGVASKAMTAGDPVVLPGLGKLVVRDRAAREGRNPKTGETVQIAASRSVRFVAAKGLKDQVSG